MLSERPERILEPIDLLASSSASEKRLLKLFRMVVRRFGFLRTCQNWGCENERTVLEETRPVYTYIENMSSLCIEIIPPLVNISYKIGAQNIP